MKIIRISWVLFVVLLFLDILVGGHGTSWLLVLSDLVAVNAIASLAPCSYEDHVKAGRWAVALCCLVMLTSLLAGLHLGPDSKAVPVSLVSVSGLFAYLAFRTKERFARGSDLLSMFGIWYSVEDYARLFWVLSLFVLSLLVVAACGMAGWTRYVLGSVASVFLLWLHAVLLVRGMRGRTMVMPEKRENEVISMIRGRAATEQMAESDGRMNRLFRRVEDYMVEKRPYLNDEFDLETMSREVYSNRLYLSRTIKQCSGQNFCQYVNGYRLKYATDRLMESGVRISDVATESGFHSISTFNMAFKAQYSLTPTEWMQMKKIEKRRKERSRPSIPTEQEP